MRNRTLPLIVTIMMALVSSWGFATPKQEVRLQLKWKHQFQFAGYYAAIEKGYYDAEGLDVKLLEASLGETPFDVVFSGKAEFGICTTDILMARDSGMKAVVLANIYQHSPHIIITLADSDIKNVHDLAGKKIAAEAEAADLHAFLLAEGMNMDSVMLEELTFDNQQLLSGAVDAITAYSTDGIFPLQQEGHQLSILYPSSSGVDFYGDLLFTSEEILIQQPELAEKFRRASLLGWQYAIAHQEEMIQLIYTKYSQRHSLDHLRFEAAETAKLIQPQVVEIGYTNPGRWKFILESYQSMGKVSKTTHIKGMLYSDYQRQPRPIPWDLIIIFTVIVSAFALIAAFYYITGRRLKREILRRKEVEIELRNNEELYRSTLKASPDDVTIADLNGIVKFVSQSGITLGGYDELDELVGRPVADFLHPDDVARAQKNIGAMFEGTYNGPEEYRLIRKDGSTLAVESNAEIIRDGMGNPTGMVLIIRDIRERKNRISEIQRINAELRQSNAEKDKFFSIIAHDLRSPFTGLLGITQILMEGIDEMPKEEVKSLAKDLNESAKTLFRLLENLLLWTRVKRGLSSPKFTEFSLAELVEKNLKLFQTSAGYKGIRIHYQKRDNPMVNADLQMTETILRNLVSNAIKFTNTGGIISIRLAKAESGMLKLNVTDNGIGMNADIQENLFRSDISVKRPGTAGESSSGLGLMLCKEFLDIMGGAIAVSSEEGKGSDFSILLPQKRD